MQTDQIGNVTYSNAVNVPFDDQSSQGSLSIYPNPAINTINLQMTDQTPGTTSYDITLTDGSGRVVKESTSAQTTWQSSVSNLQPGTYFIQVLNAKTQNLIGKTKFIKL